MKVLVIGGTGPTGPHVVNGLLRRGYEVTILHTGAHEVEFAEPVEHLHGDPNFKETLEETLGNRTFDLVVGMYGRIRHVAEVMEGRTPRFIAVGGALYEDGFPQPMPETIPVRKDTKFLHRIWLTEQVVMEAHHQGYYSATLMRYPSIYGPRQMHPIDWSIIRRVLDGRKYLILPDGGLNFNTNCYTENAAQAILLAVDKPKESAGQIYNIRDETALTVRQRVEIITRVMNYEWELVDIPSELAHFSYSYVFPNEVGFPSEGRILRPLQHKLADISKIKAELGYRDVVPVERAIERTVKWFVEHRPLPGGPEEANLADPFDYAAENRLIREFKEFSKKALAIPFAQMQLTHSYAHPKKPGE